MCYDTLIDAEAQRSLRALDTVVSSVIFFCALAIWEAIMMKLEIVGPLWYWKGPAPWYFVKVPEPHSHELHAIMSLVTYGWGMIPVQAQIGASVWQTALFPKDGTYLVPIRANIRKAERLEEGATVRIQLEIQ